MALRFVFFSACGRIFPAKFDRCAPKSARSVALAGEACLWTRRAARIKIDKKRTDGAAVRRTGYPSPGNAAAVFIVQMLSLPRRGFRRTSPSFANPPAIRCLPLIAAVS
jgi:hypothetical protein